MNQGVLEVLSSLSPGRHLIILYDGDDNRLELMAAFFSQGLAKGRRCICLSGERLSEDSLRQLSSFLPDFGDHLLRGSIVLVPQRWETQPGSSPGTAIAEAAGQALREGYTGLHVVAEMTWLLDVLTDPTAFLPLLEHLDESLAVNEVTLVSHFREDAFPPELIFNVLKKHPVIVIGDGVFENSFPDQPEGMYQGLSTRVCAAAPIPRRDPSPEKRVLVARLAEAWPAPVLLNLDHRCMANSRLDTLLADPALDGRDIIKELSALSPGTTEMQLELSDGRTFSFRCVTAHQDPALTVTVGWETIPEPAAAPESARVHPAYTTLVDSLPLGFLEIDRAGRVRAANDRTARLLGRPREEIPGRPYLELVHALDRSKAALWLARNGQAPEALEMRVASLRRECWVRAQTTPSADEDCTWVLWEDINDRKKSEVLQLLSQELVTLQDRLQFLSTRDALTGLFNRQYFQEEIRRLNNRRFAPVSILIVDVDGLKPINDNFGHPRGDELLQSAAQVLKKPFRETDMVARIGGDEFAVVLPHTPYELAQRRREEILREVQDHNERIQGPPLSLSVGVATADRDGVTLEDTIKRADDDMYRFKVASSRYLCITRKNLLARHRVSGNPQVRRLVALGGLPPTQITERTGDHDDRDAPLLS